ncbi:hypothetical protein Tco_0445291 [Tanacetum coccineum]
MSLYNIPHGSTSNSSCSACPKIPYHWECNNYAVLQSIPCSLECKIAGKILLDHPLSYALTATADVHAVYLQQFWRTVGKVPDTEDTIKFMLDTEQFTYTVDMFKDTLYFLVETSENPFVTPVNIQTIEAFMNRVGYQGMIDKVSAFYMKNLAQPWKTMFKVFNRCLTTRISGHDQTKINILQLFHATINRTNVHYAALLWIDEDYYSIKDDIPLVSVYTTGNVLVRGMLILNEFLTQEIRATDDFKEYKTAFMNVGKKRKQRAGETSSPRKPLKSYASEFADSMINDDVDDFGTRIEPKIHKEHLKIVNNDNEEIEKGNER